MPKQVIRWACETCHHEYDSFDKADACQKQKPRVMGDLKVGDYVTCSSYGWWNDEKTRHWAVVVPPDMKSALHFDHRTQYRLIWRVIGIVTDYNSGTRNGLHEHKMVYVLHTPHSPHGKPQTAWTSCDHVPAQKVDAPHDADSYEWPVPVNRPTRAYPLV